ncbi:MAG TPA: aminotransferase class I/II-fold pyridoxal phosphate-dependent enzyme [Atribacteraceae bacterium]|nr:aminotransferase class I/II-fold pyridoxal phosphate-dependent enzyme [Atribacteraceae bacterium]
MKACPHGGKWLEREQPGPSCLDFSANINPWGPPEALGEAWSGLFRYVSVYPPLDQSYCRLAIARLTGLSPETILPTNGAMQAIALLARRLPMGSYQILEPLFTEYNRTFSLEGKRIVHRILFPQEAETTMGGIFLEKDLRGLILGNPGNPTGASYSLPFLEEVIEQCRKKGTLLVVDEAFQDFMEERTSLAQRTGDLPGLFVVRSLTKFYSLAGLRGGYLVAHPDAVRKLEAHLEPWSINAVLSRALWILADTELGPFRRRTHENLCREKKYFLDSFLRWDKTVTLFPSETNFFLAKAHLPSSDLPDLLADQGILVRSAADFWGLDRQFFRFAVKTHPENQLLVKALGECLEYV